MTWKCGLHTKVVLLILLNCVTHFQDLFVKYEQWLLHKGNTEDSWHYNPFNVCSIFLAKWDLKIHSEVRRYGHQFRRLYRCNPSFQSSLKGIRCYILPRCLWIVNFIFCSVMTIMVKGKMVLGEDIQESQKWVIFVLTVMDRGKGSDIGLICCQGTEWRWWDLGQSYTLLSLYRCVSGAHVYR